MLKINTVDTLRLRDVDYRNHSNCHLKWNLNFLRVERGHIASIQKCDDGRGIRQRKEVIKKVNIEKARLKNSLWQKAQRTHATYTIHSLLY